MAFVEAKQEGKAGFDAWFDGWARRHPGVFTAGLVALMAGLTVALLLKIEAPIILYQGF